MPSARKQLEVILNQRALDIVKDIRKPFGSPLSANLHTDIDAILAVIKGLPAMQEETEPEAWNYSILGYDVDDELAYSCERSRIMGANAKIRLIVAELEER